MRRFVLFALVALLALHGVVATTLMKFEDCGSTAMTFLNITQDPAVLQRGRLATAVTTAVMKQDMDGGTYQFSAAVKLFGRERWLRLPKDSICHIIQGPCSVKKGDIIKLRTARVVMPFVRKGNYKVNFRAYDKSGKMVGCAIIPIEVGRARSKVYPAT